MVGVAGEHHAVESVGVAIFEDDVDVGGRALDALNGGEEVDAILERRDEATDVFAGAAFDGPPGVLGVEAEESVVVEEAEEGEGGEVEHLSGRGGPDGRGHGDEVEVAKIVAIAAFSEVFAERL